MRNTEDSAPYEKLRTQPVVDAEARQAERSRLSKRERRNEVRSERDRATSPDATAKTGRAVSAHGGFSTQRDGYLSSHAAISPRGALGELWLPPMP